MSNIAVIATTKGGAHLWTHQNISMTHKTSRCQKATRTMFPVALPPVFVQLRGPDGRGGDLPLSEGRLGIDRHPVRLVRLHRDTDDDGVIQLTHRILLHILAP